MLCEMCSSPNAELKIELEGSRLTVCQNCSRYGRVIGRVSVPLSQKELKRPEAREEFHKATESIQLIRNDFANVLRQAREKAGLTQKEFANKLMERESLIHNLESGHMKPSIDLARKLEKALKVSLIEQVEVESTGVSGSGEKKGAGLTIGDLLSKKK
ncbi:TIGR00270 family protein [Candidatus Woesearchaeota archaeon]|nr:TIGR00270 family protein [Candidatus Woesearchaeota archaeon]